MTTADERQVLADPTDACDGVDFKPVPGWPGAVAINPDIALERLKNGRRDAVTDSGRIILTPSLWPTRHRPRKVGWLRWEWKVTDAETGDVLTSGRAVSERWAWHKSDRAASQIYAQRLAVTVR